MKKIFSLMAFLMAITMGANAGSFYDTSSMSTYDKNAPIGWGASVTGSQDENQVTVTTLSELKTALSGTDKKTIIVDGTITFTERLNIDGVQNKTIYGLPGASLENTTHYAQADKDDKEPANKSGILTLKNCSNIIIRNLTFKGAGAYDVDGNDNLTLTACTNIWIDHCDFQDGVDGNLDCNNGSDNICVSWCRFRYLIDPWSGGSGGSDDHRFSNLWGGGDKATGDEGKLNTTFYACWWDNGCKQRMPRVRFGKVHILNCLYSTDVSSAICVAAGYRSNIYVEKSAFNLSGSAKAWQCYATSTGYTDYNIQLTGNSGASDETKSSGGIAQFVPSYAYTPMNASAVQATVSAANGAGATLTVSTTQTATTVYSWEGGNETGGTATAYNAKDASDSELDKDIKTDYIRLRGAKDFSTAYITISFNQALKAGDIINVTAYRNKNQEGKQSGFKAKFEKGSSTVASSTGMEFVNINSAVSGTNEYGTAANTCTFTVPADAHGSTTMTMTRSHTSTNLFITKLEIVSTAAGSVPSNAYTNTWQFGKSNGAEEFALQKSAEYTYTVNGHSLVINTDAGKLNNASRTDQWCQCNNGTVFKVPVFAGAKLSWGRYNGGSETGFTINGKLFNEYYIATEDGTVNMTANGISYLSYIKIEPATLYEISGTITGGNIDGSTVALTAAGNGEPYTATITGGAFTMKVPADTYTPSLSEDVAYVAKSPTSIVVSAAGSIGAITIEAAQPQTVTGQIANAPAEPFTLTFTGSSHNKQVVLAANATSYQATLDPDTYTISSSVGTLSPLSVKSFKVLTSAASHNIYFPEAAVPAATQQNITVDNTLAAASANNYKTVNDALAAAKAGSISAPVITLTSGQTYREQVIVDRANVTFKTSGTEKATITWYYGIGYAYYSLGANGYYDKDRAMTRNSIKMIDPARWGATVLVTKNGNGFKAENIVFENSFNQYYTTEEVADGVTPNGVQSITYNRTLTSGQSGYKAADAKDVTERAAAIGFENNPTGVQLYNCKFRGSQDTFYTSGKIHVKNCDIQGNTDYIFGGGYVVFDDCDLTIGGYSDKSATAYITAYKDGSSLDASKKYVFRDCTVKGTDRTYIAANLGRDWGGAAASVYFFNLKNEIGDKLSYKWTNMSGAVTAGTADLHIYDFNPTINTSYSSTGSNGANVNGVVSDADATNLYTGAVTSLGFTPEHIYDIPVDEDSHYNAIRIKASNNGTGDVTLNRTLPASKWATIVLPFALTSEQIAATFGNGTKVAQLTGVSGTEMTFASVTSMNANEPYMIFLPAALTEAKTISGVTFVDGTPQKTTVAGIDFIGSYAPSTDIPATDGSYTYYFVSSNKLYKTAASGTPNTMKGTRAYFKVPSTTAARLTGFVIDGEASGINAVVNEGTDTAVYDLQGRQLSNKGMRPDLYIVNGKKVVIR